MEETIVLGKIKSFKFGIIGYNDAMLGYQVEFSLNGGSSGIATSKGFWDYNRIKHTKDCKWTELERTHFQAELMKDISDILAKAKVHTIDKLIGMPVEVILKDFNTFKSWRILEEVL